MSIFLQKSFLSNSVAICFFSFFGCATNPAAPTTGTIQGQVTNAADDTLIAGVNVTTTPTTSAVSTDAQGKYTIPDVFPGEYTVTISKDGFSPDSVTIKVVAGQITTANMQLNAQSCQSATACSKTLPGLLLGYAMSLCV